MNPSDQVGTPTSAKELGQEYVISEQNLIASKKESSVEFIPLKVNLSSECKFHNKNIETPISLEGLSEKFLPKKSQYNTFSSPKNSSAKENQDPYAHLSSSFPSSCKVLKENEKEFEGKSIIQRKEDMYSSGGFQKENISSELEMTKFAKHFGSSCQPIGEHNQNFMQPGNESQVLQEIDNSKMNYNFPLQENKNLEKTDIMISQTDINVIPSSGCKRKEKRRKKFGSKYPPKEKESKQLLAKSQGFEEKKDDNKDPKSFFSYRAESNEIKTESLFTLSSDDYNSKVNLEQRQKYKLWDDLVIVEKLGSGSFGEVHRVFSKTSGVFFAQKKLLKKNNRFDEISASREYKALSKLYEQNNPSLLQVIQLSPPGAEFFALMEYGQGTLNDFASFLISRNYKWKDEDLLNLYFQLCNQIKELDNIFLCHRDIKPANIIISNDGTFKLADYGLAQVLEKKGLQIMNPAGTKGYWDPRIDFAHKNNVECVINPYEAGHYSVKQTVNEIMRRDGRIDTIDDLLKILNRYPGITGKNNNQIKIYESHKKAYKMYHFEKLYQKLTLREKYKTLHIFLEYYNFKEVHKWLNDKIRNLWRKNKQSMPDNDGETQLILFLKAEICHLKGKYEKARKLYRLSEKKAIKRIKIF